MEEDKKQRIKSILKKFSTAALAICITASAAAFALGKVLKKKQPKDLQKNIDAITNIIAINDSLGSVHDINKGTIKHNTLTVNQIFYEEYLNMMEEDQDNLGIIDTYIRNKHLSYLYNYSEPLEHAEKEFKDRLDDFEFVARMNEIITNTHFITHFEPSDEYKSTLPSNDKRAIATLLRDYSAVAIGEDHNWTYIYDYMADIAPMLKDHGVTTVYTEFLYQIQNEHLNQMLDNSKTIEEFELQLLSHEYMNYKVSMPHWVREIWAYHKAGLRIVGLDDHIVLFIDEYNEINGTDYTYEDDLNKFTTMRNMLWAQRITHDAAYLNGEKFIIRSGYGHNGSPSLDDPGIEDMLGQEIPAITIFDLGHKFEDNKMVLDNRKYSPLDGYILINGDSIPKIN